MSDIKSAILNITGNLAKTSSELVKNTKLSVELANEEENLKSLYIEIGKKVHEIYSFGGSLGNVFDEKYREIIVAESKINSIRERIDVVKGVKACVKCGKGVPRNSEFCPHCGASMSGIAAASPPINTSPPDLNTAQINKLEETEIPPVEEKPQEFKICNSCGGKNDKNARFCLSCGRLM